MTKYPALVCLLFCLLGKNSQSIDLQSENLSPAQIRDKAESLRATARRSLRPEKRGLRKNANHRGSCEKVNYIKALPSEGRELGSCSSNIRYTDCYEPVGMDPRFGRETFFYDDKSNVTCQKLGYNTGCEFHTDEQEKKVKICYLY